MRRILVLTGLLMAPLGVVSCDDAGVDPFAERDFSAAVDMAAAAAVDMAADLTTVAKVDLAGMPGLAPCLDRPEALDTVPSPGLPCELIPPTF